MWPIDELRKTYAKQPYTALTYSNNMQLLVAVMMSAQTTDKQVNKVCEKIFPKYKTPADFAKLKLSSFEQEIRSTGFYKNKAKNVINTAKKIIKDYDGKVPDTMAELITLPGVARKTANIVLSQGFGKTCGIAVDTHVGRLAQRLGLTKNEDPKKIEIDLMKRFERKDWPDVTRLLIWHGRAICYARKPNCDGCVLNKKCPSAFKRFPND